MSIFVWALAFALIWAVSLVASALVSKERLTGLRVGILALASFAASGVLFALAIACTPSVEVHQAAMDSQSTSTMASTSASTSSPSVSDSGTESDRALSESASSEATAPDDVKRPEEPEASDEPLAPQQKSVVCIGDSITSGGVPTYSEKTAWPERLQGLLYDLYDDWTVVNLGVSSTMLLDEAAYPYRSTGNVEAAKGLAPDMAIIMLGTNDSSDPSWSPDAFRAELRALVEELQAAVPGVELVLMAPPSAFCDPNPYGVGVFHMNDAVIGQQIRPIVSEVAESTGSRYVDLYAFTENHPEWFPDTVHPASEGNAAIASYIFEQVFAGRL